MYKVNDMVLYSTYGVCKITDVTERIMGNTCLEYYILKPVNDLSMLIYIPAQNEKLTSKIRRMLTAEEIYSLVKSMPEISTVWIEDARMRHDNYRQILAQGDRAGLVTIIQTLYLQQQTLSETKKGKQLSAEDREILRLSEKLLHEEFAYVLNIKPDQVLPFILGQIDIVTSSGEAE
ncbi:MAG: CarD family transcriptional regulator [Clostridiaceae bacterium]|jgi:CarD family transcriptional regulator|nr:CarD family transcriptional regulator [Clostridiaceae bacterium]